MKTTIFPDSFLRRMERSERLRLGKAGRTDEEIQAHIENLAERDLHKHITNLLRQRGVRFIGHSRFGVKTTFTPDAPDFLFVYRGRPFGIEAKSDNKAPSVDQMRCHAEMREDGWFVFTVRSVGDLKTILDV